MANQQKDKTSSVIAIAFHIVIVLGIVFFASREGMLGSKLKELTVVIVPKTKPVEQPKPKVQEPKLDIPKPVESQELPKTVIPQQTTSHPQNSIPSVSPSPVELPSFSFNDGAKDVISSNDPIELYKTYVEHYLKSKWKTPEIEGVVEIEISIDVEGKITSYVIKYVTEKLWEKSILNLFTQIKEFPKPPPKNFPLTFRIKFDSVEQ